MITITTINNSWYFLGNLVIKPNSSSTYQEENLSKNQAKDLLESISSKRVNLSSEDLIKVQNRYNSFNSGGNVDLSEILSKIEEIYKDGGASGATLTNVDYNNGVFNYTNGTVNGYVGYTAVESISVVQSGTLTVSSIPAGVTYIAVISGNQVPNDFPSVLLILGDGTISVTQTTYPVSYGDTIEIQWTANSISALINGQWVSSTIGNTLNDPHLLVYSILNTAPLYFSIPGFVPGSTRSGVLVEEIDERIQADLDITADISTVRTLAETNQLNISERVLQTDFDSLAEIVTDNGLVLAQKASQSDLDILAYEVSTKATPADISAAIAAVVDGAPGALDTLYEIAGELAGNQASINDLLTQINARVRFDDVQSLTTAEQLQARQNISAEQIGVAAALVAAITAASIGAATAAQGAKADSALQSGDVAPVALSGSYTALSDKPTITNPVNADWNSSSGLSQILNKPRVIPQATLLFNRYNSYYPAGFLYDCVYPNLISLGGMGVPPFVQYYVPFYVLETKTFTSLWIRFLSFPSTSDSYQLGIYASKADKSGPGNSLYISPARAFSYQSNANNKSETFSISLTVGQVVWLSVLLLSYNGNANVLGTFIGAGSMIHPASTPDTIGMFMLQTTAGITAMPSVAHDDTAFSTAAQGTYMPRLMLGT